MGQAGSQQHSMDTRENSVFQEQEIPEGNGSIFFGQVLPAELCEEVFLNVPSRDLIRSLPQVCSYWHHLLTDKNFWFRKLEREGFKLSKDSAVRLAEERDDSKVLRILQGISGGFLPFNCNLIRNPSGEDGFRHWIVKHGGDSLKVECPPVGSDSIPEEAGLPTQHCFVSSYRSCSRSQTIILKELGIELWMMDILRPEIKVSEWVSARWDCDSKSQTIVKLFRSTGKPHICGMTWSTRDDGYVHSKWYKMVKDISYDAYTRKLTAIEFTNESSDLQFWAGHYGAKTAGSSVILQL